MNSNRDQGVNLPRWGLKRTNFKKGGQSMTCKFTPLGFETFPGMRQIDAELSVNLPRWGLKLCLSLTAFTTSTRVNLPRWGLKRIIARKSTAKATCKFTPLGFETRYK